MAFGYTDLEIDEEQQLLTLDLTKVREELNDQAFEFYFRRKIIYFLYTLENHMGDLSILNDFQITFKVDVFDQLEKGIKEYLAIKKEIKTHYPGVPLESMIHTQLIDLSKLIPPTKKMHRKILNLIYVYKLPVADFIHWLNGQQLDFYKDKQTELYAYSIFTGFINSNHFYRALRSNCFHFTYIGVRKSDISSFSNKLLDKTYHLNDILKMQNNDLDPVCFFGEGLGGYYKWEPDNLYS